MVFLVHWTFDEQSGVEAVCASRAGAEAAQKELLRKHARPTGDPETWPPNLPWPPLGPDDVSIQEWEVGP